MFVHLKLDLRYTHPEERESRHEGLCQTFRIRQVREMEFS
jgi:hypothetical protein